MKISANSVRQGDILVHENGLWNVIDMPKHIKPGKGGAYVQVEMKNIKSGTKLNIRFSSTDVLEKAHLEHRAFEYLYAEGKNLIFMDQESFEQITIPSDILGERLAFLQENMQVQVEFFEETPLSVQLPATVIVTIEETEPVIKGATVTATYKPATLDNGLRVMVPAYVGSGQKIVVKTQDCTFVERAK